MIQALFTNQAGLTRFQGDEREADKEEIETWLQDDRANAVVITVNKVRVAIYRYDLNGDGFFVQFHKSLDHIGHELDHGYLDGVEPDLVTAQEAIEKALVLSRTV